jgi:hypothetical protein
MHPFYRKYRDMLTRCTYKKFHQYADYGGRGIRIEWYDFPEFHRDMYSSFVKHVQQHGLRNTQLDRINNDGNYSKENCRWATKKQNARNTRSTKHITYQGVTKPMIEWASHLNIDYHTLANRLNKYGWTVERAFTEPAIPKKNGNWSKPITFNGVTLTPKEWAARTDIPFGTLRYRLFRKNWPVERALTERLHR